MQKMGDKQIEFFKIILAGKKIEIECNYRLVFSQCRDYLADFECPDFVVRASIDELIAERMETPEIQNHAPGIAVSYADAFAEPRIVYNKIADKLIDYDTLLMHGSVVALKGKGYMFSANSGVGKTTRTKVWMDVYPGSIVINGDKPLVRVTDGEVVAYGSPWCGEEGWNTNASVPLRAIFFIERADNGEKNSIEEIGIENAFPLLVRQTHAPNTSEMLIKTIHLLKSFEGKVKLYKLRSAPTAEAIRLAYETANLR